MSNILALVLRLTTEELLNANTNEKQDTLRKRVYDRAFGFLSPYQGKEFTSFEPANTAWRQPLYHPHGVVLGTTDPGLSVYLFSMAASHQREQVEQLLITHLSKTAESSLSVESEGIGFTAFAMKPDSLRSCEWFSRFLRGDFQADSVLYSIDRRKGSLENPERNEIMQDSKNHALCILRISIR